MNCRINADRILLHYLKLRVVVHLKNKHIRSSTKELVRENIEIGGLHVGYVLLLHDLRPVDQNILGEF